MFIFANLNSSIFTPSFLGCIFHLLVLISKTPIFQNTSLNIFNFTARRALVIPHVMFVLNSAKKKKKNTNETKRNIHTNCNNKNWNKSLHWFCGVRKPLTLLAHLNLCMQIYFVLLWKNIHRAAEEENKKNHKKRIMHSIWISGCRVFHSVFLFVFSIEDFFLSFDKHICMEMCVSVGVRMFNLLVTFANLWLALSAVFIFYARQIQSALWSFLRGFFLLCFRWIVYDFWVRFGEVDVRYLSVFLTVIFTKCYKIVIIKANNLCTGWDEHLDCCHF